MKTSHTLKILLLGLACTLALGTKVSANAGRDWSAWVENYYQHPDAERLVPAVYALSRSGHFEAPGQPARAIGFLATVFAQNPDKVSGWVRDFRDLPTSHRRLVAAAVWYSGLPQGNDVLRTAARDADPALRAEIEGLLAAGRPSLSGTPVLSQSSLDLQWGAFLGNGDPEHVRAIFAALGSDAPGLNASVRQALAEKAMAHPRVYEICQTEISRQPAGMREQLSTALLQPRAN